jgi:hypothetical protein
MPRDGGEGDTAGVELSCKREKSAATPIRTKAAADF